MRAPIIARGYGLYNVYSKSYKTNLPLLTLVSSSPLYIILYWEHESGVCVCVCVHASIVVGIVVCNTNTYLMW